MSLYPYDLPPADELTPDQWDGFDCTYCPGNRDGAMRVVGRIRGRVLFAHVECADKHRWPES
ncbi:hypothetical protein OTB20_08640 [Streptomyces sp. H27-H1]|uniref:hypothetical protein n=1 Tax=Streptomyces sp. H27-H1 TaxID=2996461 RepID=UPI00226E521C|nr:hypothetical protein [Streptomyces sp. H27-H1]MCY0926273.1 hypothetical protein [Streptomyces sp. H27-H1]